MLNEELVMSFQSAMMLKMQLHGALYSNDGCRVNGSALMQQLIKRMLSIGASLAKQNWTGNIVNLLAITGYRFAIALHVELLQIRRQTSDNVETEAGVGRGGSGPETECYLAGSERAP